MKTGFKFKINTGIALLLVLCLIVLLGAYSLISHKQTDISEFVININNKYESNFINDTEIRDLINKIGVERNGESEESPSLKEIEQKLEAVDFIKKAEVSKDIQGNMIIDVYQDRPIARIIAGNGQSAYINQERKLLDLSNKYTARVLLVTGSGASKLFKKGYFDTEEGQHLFDMISFLGQDKFWQAQLTQLDLNSQMEITAYTQVGKEVIEMGTAEGFRRKLGKLRVFYNEIIPKMGWNYYNTIKLQYKDQIVCK
ncbi:hypothetical protein V6R21_23985 [Limibacter armeniacum]|uniref:cell division protein FtsQ/DivIB n=1 Tax=Limibacter armeniacum TaxID=466084 RepID=UPI002FE68C51